MNAENYQIQASRTVAKLGDMSLDLSHMALGMASEINELNDAFKKQDKVNIGEELADICWYVFNMGTLVGSDLNKELNTLPEYWNPTGSLEDTISIICDQVKRCIAYGKQLDLGTLNSNLVNCINHVILLCSLNDISFPTILENNINKLKVRYPEKFSNERALNRDLETEYTKLKNNINA